MAAVLAESLRLICIRERRGPCVLRLYICERVFVWPPSVVGIFVWWYYLSGVCASEERMY